MSNSSYFAVEYIFNLASAARHGCGEPLALRKELRRRGLRSGTFEIPRLTFWLRLCEKAALLERTPLPFPTDLLEGWLGWPLLEQIKYLVEAWRKIPSTTKSRQIRKHILQKLKEGHPLNQAERLEMGGLQVLGVCAGEGLSELGEAVLGNRTQTEAAAARTALEPPGPWRAQDGRLEIPFPPDWRLLWRLEQYLDPESPGIYRLDAAALRLAAQRAGTGSIQALLEFLRQMLGSEFTLENLAEIDERPAVKLISGWVIEFGETETLKMLRGLPACRRQLDHLLSPRHAVLDSLTGEAVLRCLYQRGLLAEQDFAQVAAMRQAKGRPAAHLTKADRAFLLRVLLCAGGLRQDAPPGILDRLTAGVEQKLITAAAKKAYEHLRGVSWQPSIEPPEQAGLPLELLNARLQQAIQREETVDVFYTATGRHAPEYRRVSPLLLEQRGDRSYLIAYCHLRRAERTFRLDRLKLADENA